MRSAKQPMVALSFAVPLAEAIPESVLVDVARSIAQLSLKANERDTGIHEARRAIRRVRAKLALLRPAIGRDATRAVQAPWREAGQALSALRDADALCKAIATARVDVDGAFDPAALALLEVTARRRLRRAAERHEGVVEAVRRMLQEARSALPDWHNFDDAAFVAGLRAGYRRSVRRLGALREDDGAEAWHALRRAVRTHWLQLELVVPVWPAVLKAQVRQARRLSQMLGAERDLAMVEALAAGSRRRGNDGARVRALLPRLAAERARMRALALRRARRQFNERTPDFARRIARLILLARTERAVADIPPCAEQGIQKNREQA